MISCLRKDVLLMPTGSTSGRVQLSGIQNCQLLEPKEAATEEAGEQDRTKNEQMDMVDKPMACVGSKKTLQRLVQGGQQLGSTMVICCLGRLFSASFVLGLPRGESIAHS